MNKEIITRTSGKRLGYINQMYVDPVNLCVVSLYLRSEMLSVGSLAGRSAAGADHVHLYNLVQIGDVVLVHDEQALMSPPADDTCGFYRLIGSVVRTERGVVLGKVRDYLFNPDNGAISALKVDGLGIPSIPQSIMTTYAVSWQEVLGVGPAEVVVRSGAEQRALKENEGLVGEGINSLIQILTLSDDQDKLPTPGQGDPNQFRTDAPYLEWYAKYGKAYEEFAAQYGQQMPQPPRQQAQQQPRRDTPRALPPPRSTPFSQAIQAQPPQQQAGQTWQQAVGSREAVPANARGWATPPASQRSPPPPQYPPQGWQQQQQPPAPPRPAGRGEAQPPSGRRTIQQPSWPQQQQGPPPSGQPGGAVPGRGGPPPSPGAPFNTGSTAGAAGPQPQQQERGGASVAGGKPPVPSRMGGQQQQGPGAAQRGAIPPGAGGTVPRYTPPPAGRGGPQKASAGQAGTGPGAGTAQPPASQQQQQQQGQRRQE